MPLEADTLVAKRKLRRRVTFWRVLAILFAIATVVMVGAGGLPDGLQLGKHGEHVARVRIEGFISGDQPTLDMLEKIEESNSTKALVLHVDSPGGTTAGAEAIYEHIRKISEKMPVVAVMGTVAASGGYITALGADHIVARGNTITGSIGVIVQWAQVRSLLDNLGIQVLERKSGDLKAQPNFFDRPSEEALAVTDAMIKDSFDWFAGLVRDRRQLNTAQMSVVGDGRVFTGRQAIELKLVDTIGGETQARAWLEDEHGVSKETKSVDWEPDASKSRSTLGLLGVHALVRWFGLEPAIGALNEQSGRLDGLLALWHPRLQ